MKTPQGFTLVEMSIVLIIIGFLIGGMFAPLSMQMNQQKIRDTKKTLQTIKEALMGYAILNDRLPCPAKCYKYEDNNCFNNVYNIDYVGKEDTADTTNFCEQEGYLPWADLGTDKLDAWGHPFKYHIDKTFTAINIPNPPDTNDLMIQDNSSSTPNSLSFSNVIAIIYSCGKNGMPDATNRDDYASYSGANCPIPSPLNANDTYTQGFYVENKFDDILVWLPKTILINQLVSAGKWPP